MQKLLRLIKKYDHAFLLLYGPIYMYCFKYLEYRQVSHLHIINGTLDNYIPFIEIFVVPYLLWFLYLFVYQVYLFFADKEIFVKTMLIEIVGMTIFLLVSWLYPNGLTLRPDHFARDNIFTQLLTILYRIDTPTNVLPSIHVFNTMAVFFGINRSKKMEKVKVMRWIGDVMTVLIILSTMFIKQHSILDVVTAFILVWICYAFAYEHAWENIKNYFSSGSQSQCVKNQEKV